MGSGKEERLRESSSLLGLQSEAHLHNIAKEAERRALEAYNALEEGLKMVHATPKEMLPGGLLPMSFKIEDGRVPERAEKAANRESATEAEKGEAAAARAAARAAATAAWARADDSALRKSEAHLHNTCTTCRGHGSGGARRFDQLSSTQIDAA